MDVEKIKEIYAKGYEDKYNEDAINAEFKGLAVLARFSSNMTVTAIEGQIFAEIGPKPLSEMKPKDIREMFDENWLWSEEEGCFTIHVISL